ncbi:hypothetical protein MHU86_5222 [Fragilaria crotonensis]|nr:hypothetical protein MHU86_5222 [Fragilaria crotonensis]
MRTLLPLRDLLGEICKELTLPPDFKSTIRCRVFEDNNGALLLATKQRITNRTKYFLVKWHFFGTTSATEMSKCSRLQPLTSWLTTLPRASIEKFSNAFKACSRLVTRGTAALVLGGFKSVPSYPASPYVYCSCPTFSPHHH